MKKNKTIAYMLAAALLVGGTFVGTKAYFTDSVESKTNLILSMGDVDVSAEDTEWKYETTVHGKKEATAFRLLNSDSFMNVKPGDKFVKEVIIKNSSNIDTDLVIEGGDIKAGTKLAEAINDGFIKITDNREDVIDTLNNNNESDGFGTNNENTAKLIINVEIQSTTPDKDNKYNSNGGQIIDLNFANEINPYVINAKQYGVTE